MSTYVSIAGIDKARLTYALWQEAPVAVCESKDNSPPGPTTLTIEEVQTMGQSCNWKFDHLAGRVMNCDLSEDMVDPLVYDRDNGDGAFRAFVDSFRRDQDELCLAL